MLPGDNKFAAIVKKMERSNKNRPNWLRKRLITNEKLESVYSLLRKYDLHTVCEEAHCPNLGECFSKGTSTFMILGNRCTRNCAFCAVDHGMPNIPDESEPDMVAKAAHELKLSYVVLTSVTRDDLTDGGASHFAETIQAIKRLNPRSIVEVLIPDFCGSRRALQIVVNAKPAVINHNIETVPRLYGNVRPQADYKRSLEVLNRVKCMDKSILTKSGFMLGLGEDKAEVIQSMRDLHKTGCDILTMGQYLTPSPEHHPSVEYIHPDKFSSLKQTAYDLGFKSVASGPFVRSSYFAHELFDKIGQMLSNI
jgi:lipoic acid synthetase